MLPGARLGDDALDAETFREQCLANRVIDLVRTRVREVLALQPDLGTPAFTKSRRMRQRGRPADPLAQLTLELRLEGPGSCRCSFTPASSRSKAGTSVSGT